ncbi:MAG: hypothetical protein Hyperionvirus16_37 [Hyperionvirus sp.]|uniref:Uncharacterized protein n=1 Tax=Hyperionvirus sp. TaxID=2487770 RepID=A0A3G5AAE9_9VIRU|nr:MAG: hypothetical protein Hyperionvirus16_37 [Hyperionvirus sp.]
MSSVVIVGMLYSISRWVKFNCLSTSGPIEVFLSRDREHNGRHMISISVRLLFSSKLNFLRFVNFCNVVPLIMLLELKLSSSSCVIFSNIPAVVVDRHKEVKLIIAEISLRNTPYPESTP